MWPAKIKVLKQQIWEVSQETTQAEHRTVMIIVHKFYTQVQRSQVAFQWSTLKYDEIAKDHQKLKKVFAMKETKAKRKKKTKGKKTTEKDTNF